MPESNFDHSFVTQSPIVWKNEVSGHSVLEDILNSLDTAVLFFSQKGALVAVNQQACKIIPGLCRSDDDLFSEVDPSNPCCEECEERKKHFSFKDLIRFVYDHSVDHSDQEGLFNHNVQNGTEKIVFHEVIRIDPSSFFIVRAMEHLNTGILVEISDVSLIKDRTDHLRILDSENRILLEAIHNSNRGIFIADGAKPENPIVFVNAILSSLLDASSSEIYKGMELKIFLQKFFPDKWEEILKSLNQAGVSEFWRSHTDFKGNTVWLELRLSVDMKNERPLITGFISDQTQLKQQENQLRQSQKLEAIGHLAGGIAHDFNNILSIIDGYTRLSAAALKRGENTEEFLKKISMAVKRGSGLTEQLLLFGKHRITEDTSVNICKVVKNTEMLLSPLLGANISLIIQTDKKDLFIKGTTDSLTQIIMNLVLNARDAMPDGGDIIMTVFENEHLGMEGVNFRVSDTGCGIPEAIIEKIFDPFFTTKEQGKGTGLGLSMVYRLVQQMGGELEVESEPEEGTSFTIWFPISKQDVEEIVEEKRNLQKNSLAGRTILLVEDEVDLLEIMEHTLEDFGLTVLKATNGNEALGIQDEYEGEIDFLLTDMVMPQCGGVKLSELMGEVRPNTSVVFMSGYPVKGDVASVALPDNAIFLAKPVKTDDLRNILEQLSSGVDAKVASAVWGGNKHFGEENVEK